ncbi:hypothetical protein OUZ56_024970 [Daphnia magna]|uniref:RRM domain-containing protein n=1 Tax=Daphnia magna TaxID=35525 RepID=A0ABQ9ZII2_9CRUS|nr:hypothetical protein OUZ56_024970 [Daphnia magna]
MLRSSAKGPGFGGVVSGINIGGENRAISRGRGRGDGDRGISRGRGRGGGDRGGFRGSSRGRGGGDHEGFRGGGRGRGMGDREGFRGGRGRGMGDRGGFRGRGRGVGFQEGFRGTSRGRGVGMRGDRGGFRGSSGSFRGSDRGVSSRGRGVGTRGDRGGFRGSRGSFRGSDRGSHENGFGRGVRGSWADSDSLGRGGSFGRGRGRGHLAPAVPKQMPNQTQKESEIQLGLQLYVIFKKTPVVIHELEKLPGFHSVSDPPSKKELEKIILFKDIASLEAAKTTLDEHKNVQSAKRMGVESSCRMLKTPDACKVYLGFNEAVDEIAVKKLDDGIKEVAILSEKTSCELQFATSEQTRIAFGKLKGICQKIKNLLDIQKYEPMDLIALTGRMQENQALMNKLYLRFSEAYDLKKICDILKKTGAMEVVLPLYSCTAQFATRKEAVDAVGRLKIKIGENALRFVNLYCESLTTDKNLHPNKIVLRDVSKNVALKDFVTQFPNAISVVIYKKTFPASNFCHAHVGFGTLKEAAEARELTDLKIAGRKVYIFPAYLELMQDLPNLGSPKKKKAVKDVEAEEEPPSKKKKTEKGSEKSADEENPEGRDAERGDVENENAECEDVEDEDAECEDVEDEDAECEDVEDEDAECEDVEDEDAECEDVGEEDAECEDVGEEDAECEDVREEDAECEDVGEEDAECEDIGEEDAECEDVGEEDEEEEDKGEEDESEGEDHHEDEDGESN